MQPWLSVKEILEDLRLMQRLPLTEQGSADSGNPPRKVGDLKLLCVGPELKEWS